MLNPIEFLASSASVIFDWSTVGEILIWKPPAWYLTLSKFNEGYIVGMIVWEVPNCRKRQCWVSKGNAKKSNLQYRVTVQSFQPWIELMFDPSSFSCKNGLSDTANFWNKTGSYNDLQPSRFSVYISCSGSQRNSIFFGDSLICTICFDTAEKFALSLSSPHSISCDILILILSFFHQFQEQELLAGKNRL